MKIESGTIIRTVLLVVALANQVLVSTGHSVLPFDDATVTNIITLGFTVVTGALAWWKNNSFTKKAIEADKTMKEGK
jgi:SPP1 family holin